MTDISRERLDQLLNRTMWHDTLLCEFAVALRAAMDKADQERYIPGQWRCAKCEFELTQINLNVRDGTATARDDAGDKCPNCNSPLRRVTWKDRASQMLDATEKQVLRAIDAERDRDRYKEFHANGQKTIEALLAARVESGRGVVSIAQTTTDAHHGLDTADRVCFYEQEFYVLSNFSAFEVEICCEQFPTSEAAYHWFKFPDHPNLQFDVRTARSAHEAFKIAEANRQLRRSDWDDVKLDVMRRIIRAKVEQHEYVRRKLLETGDRELVENSWRDSYWGWGESRDGLNMLGRLWMELRAELRQ